MFLYVHVVPVEARFAIKIKNFTIMATSEHQNLAAFIKSIHSNLRKKSHVYGPEEAWRQHLAESEMLEKYAKSMHELATKYWAKNVADPTKNTKCRIDWVKCQCFEYFFEGGNELYLGKELNIKLKMTKNGTVDQTLTNSENAFSGTLEQTNQTTDTAELTIETTSFGTNYVSVDESESNSHISIRKFDQSSLTRSNIDQIIESHEHEMTGTGEHNSITTQSLTVGISKIKLLDVGSCYNPFGNIDFLDVIPIDLAPSCDGVFQCDFLSLRVGFENIFSENKKQVLQLTQGSFDTVVFCLVLEYLPCPEQRYSCCRKAYDLLKRGGLLLIITPDSKHVGANAKFMKSWRYVLSNLGFMRIKYEKLPHAHCVAFRKCHCKEVAARWSAMQKISKPHELYQFDDKMFIPQDFKESK